MYSIVAQYHGGLLVSLKVGKSTEDNPRSVRQSTATDYTSEVIANDILLEDRRKTCEEIAHEARMSVASVYRIITNNLKMRKVAAR